jgi:hypothetical protein
MTLITINPPQKTVNFGNGEVAGGVDMTTVDPPTEVILFNTETQSGFVQFFSESSDYPTRPPETISSLDPWESQLKEAEEIVYCRNNPKTFYGTATPVGSPIVVTAKGWPQPANSTEVAPLARPSENTTLYWDGTKFVWSPFPINLDLISAQNYITGLINEKAYTLLQPSDWYVVRQSETGKAIPEERSTWRAAVRAIASEKRTTIASQESVESLRIYCQSENFQTW